MPVDTHAQAHTHARGHACTGTHTNSFAFAHTSTHRRTRHGVTCTCTRTYVEVHRGAAPGAWPRRGRSSRSRSRWRRSRRFTMSPGCPPRDVGPVWFVDAPPQWQRRQARGRGRGRGCTTGGDLAWDAPPGHCLKFLVSSGRSFPCLAAPSLAPIAGPVFAHPAGSRRCPRRDCSGRPGRTGRQDRQPRFKPGCDPRQPQVRINRLEAAGGGQRRGVQPETTTSTG
jgi:hypothetical protein